jgi:two-component system, LytTR family, sensor kinase
MQFKKEKESVKQVHIEPTSLKNQLLFALISWLFYAFFFGHNETDLTPVLSLSALLLPVTLITSYYVNAILLPRYYFTKRFDQFAIKGAYTLVLSAFFITATYTFAFIILGDMRLVNLPSMSNDMLVVMVTVYIVVVSHAVVGLMAQSNIVNAENQALKSKMLESELKMKIQELENLKNQINPHFLFNSLNTIYGMALKQSELTADAIIKLSNLLDYALYRTSEKRVPLASEIDHIKDYIALEELRFRDKVKVELEIIGELEHVKIPPLLFIPFVENCFKHGLSLNGVLTIKIEIYVNENGITVKIENPQKQNRAVNKAGIGIANTRRRLELLYGNKFELEIDDGGELFIVKLDINTAITNGSD